MMRCSSSRRAGPADRLRRGDPGAEHRRTGRGGRLRPGSLRLGRTRAADRLGRDRTRTAAPPVRRRSRQPVPPPEHDETRAAQADMATARDAVPDRTGTARKSVPSDRDAGQSHARRADRRDTLVSPAGFDDLLKVAQQIDHEHRIRHSPRSPPRRCARKCGSVPPAPGHLSSGSAGCTNRRRRRNLIPAAKPHQRRRDDAHASHTRNDRRSQLPVPASKFAAVLT